MNTSKGDAGIREESGIGVSQLDTSPDKDIRTSYPKAKEDPYASCGNCQHLYWSFERKARYCREAPDGDSVQLHNWCPDWKADVIEGYYQRSSTSARGVGE